MERLLDELITRHSDLVGSLEPLCEALADAYFTDRYPGFDLDDPDWPLLSQQIEAVEKLMETVDARVVGKET